VVTGWQLLFDGGSEGNPGRGYGSYVLREAGQPWPPPTRLAFGDGVTSNEAEYRSLIAALEALAGAVADPAQVALEVIGDSQLVIRQLQGAWKVRAANLVPLAGRARELAQAYGRVRYTWRPRAYSVAILGH
jgi:probable phosphoglycerate mutase